jgi:ribonucleoside-diphosphate reductase alpha chain
MVDLSLNISKLNIPEAQKHIEDFRTVGIGLMGLADWLAYNESYYSDLDLIEATQKTVSQAAYKASVQLASQWGLSDAPYLDNTFWKKLGGPSGARPRNTMLLATAPNTSTSLVMGATASFLPPYQTEFVDESEDSVEVVTKYAPDLYLTNQQIPQEFITDCTARIQYWTDAGISMEYLLPKGASWSTNKRFSDNKISAWKQGVKAVYYCRSVDGTGQSCSSCAN